ncbi:MAG: YtxH domain-containing protein [Eggerthellaceae bacterium]|jgi:gas vesicle protein|nr:YtxH domain-containing protein [Eggerthellaceae bacterium]MDR2721338.1 YtxH domain-containing protein [Coriobacteriaceae bacterium]
MGKGLGAFIVGGLVGAAVALLYAPRPGDETRAIVSDKLNESWGQAQDFGVQASANVQQIYRDATTKGQEVYNTVTTKGQEVAQTVAAKGQELYEVASTKVQETASNVKPVFTEKNDELREKIEAARARIASQVAKNAEGNDGASEVAEAASKAADKAE